MHELMTDFNEIVKMIEDRRNNAYRKVNEELISLYWDVGKYLYELIVKSNYGDKIIDKVAFFMKDKHPTIKGFTRRNLYRMVEFYKIYKDDETVSPLVTQLSWTNNMLILGGTKTKEEREFYLRLAIKEKYSKRELNRQLNSSYYQRYMLSNGKINMSLEKIIDEDDYPNTKLLDTYSLEFLDLPSEFTEKDLKSSIIKNMKNFILEIGKNFTFIGKEYRIQVGNEDFYIDLLFYNRELSCLVAFELKLGSFKPEYISKMDFYLEALDRQEKRKNENPSVGIILCTNKNEKVVEYAMSRTMSPTLVAEYQLKLIDKKLLESKLIEFSELVR